MRLNQYFIILFVAVVTSCSDDAPPSIDPPVVLYSSISDRSLSYGQNIALSVTPENQGVEYDIQWYLTNEDGLEKEVIGVGNDISYSAPYDLGKYYISVIISDEYSSLTEEIGVINIYGWAEQNFTSVDDAWKTFNGAFVRATDNGAVITIPGDEPYGGMATSVSDFASGEIITPPFAVASTVNIGDGFEKGDYVELYLVWKDVDSSLTFRSVRVRLFPKSSDEHGFWTAFTRSYNSKTDEFKNANLNYSFLADPSIDIVTSDANELKISVDEDKTVMAYINETIVCSIALEDLILESSQMSWELESILVVTQSGITLERVVLQ